MRRFLTVILATVIGLHASCSSEIESQTARAQAALPMVLKASVAQLTIPADTLPGNTPVTLSAHELEAYDDAPNLGTGIALAPVIDLEFKASEPIIGTLVVKISLPDDVPQHVYLLQRIQGGALSEGSTDSGWLLSFGRLDREQGTLTVQLRSTADKISLVVVGRGDVNPRTTSVNATLQRIERRLFAGLGIAVAQAAGSVAEAHDSSVVDLSSRGWVVFCQPENQVDQQSCSLSQEQLDAMADAAVNSAAVLYDLGFRRANLHILPRSDINTAGFPHSIAETSTKLRIPEEYFVLVVARNLKDDGEYAHISGIPYIQGTDARKAIIHEMLHAVQYAEALHVVPRDWIAEGTAAAIEPLAPGVYDARGANYRYDEDMRDWEQALSQNTGITRYRTGELWQHMDGDLTYLPQLYRALHAGVSDFVRSSPEDYQLVDRVLADLRGEDLKESYTKLIETRTRGEYPYCTSLTPLCTSNSCDIGDSFDWLIEPMTAICYDVVIEQPDDDCDNPTLELEFEGDEAAHRFIIRGERYTPGESVTIEPKFSISLANVAFEDHDGALAQVTGEFRCPLPIQVTAQEHALSVATSAVLRCPPYATGPGCPILENLVHDQGFAQTSDLAESETRVRTWERYDPHVATQYDENHRKTPVGGVRSLSRLLHADRATPAVAIARLQTRIEESGGEFTVRGSYRVAAQMPTTGNWAGTANAEVEYMVALTLGIPANVVVSDCDLFQVTGSVEPAARSGGECTYRGFLEKEDLQIMQDLNFDYAALLGEAKANEYEQIAGYFQGDWIILQMHQQAFQSSERLDRDIENHFTIRVVPKD